MFEGRLDPNIQPDPDKPLTVVFNSPESADELITLKIKEVDTYMESEGRQIREGSGDDLLATFTGRILSDEARRFRVISHTNESDDTSLPTIKIKFQGSETVYEIPVVSEEGESEGTNWSSTRASPIGS